ncbi:serine protease 33-like [Clavelina lepadiformis]|uniref:serine protease 33-like n=1 Tax=Clavelina lepadiformis TaxID=159417 RepID=UPI004041E6CA
MLPLFKIPIAVILLITFTMDFFGKSQACKDYLISCSSYSCSHPAIRYICPATCKTCKNDPCILMSKVCDHICNAINGEVSCSCKPGFKLAEDNVTCIDINECTEGPNPCPTSHNQQCINTIGSYSCQAYKCSEEGTMNYYRSEKCCNFKNSSCGITSTIRQRITAGAFSSHDLLRVYGGYSAAKTAWPWMAQIVYQGKPATFESSLCGASLISDRWLLSAAHCFVNPRLPENAHRDMVVYLGHTTNAMYRFMAHFNRVERHIPQVFIHPEYFNLRNDIALVQLDRPVVFNNVISPIGLPWGEVPKVGDKCWATGFGASETTSSTNLVEVDLPVVSHPECTRAYAGYRDTHIDKRKMLCAGYPQGQKDTCRGDSGGPLACQRKDSCEWYLAGITSFGKGCAQAGLYGVYVNVANYEAWVRENMGQHENELCGKVITVFHFT